ncbi:hypothetical protein Sango_1607800 [Sesamum angolense]|uniref:Uncharacterized protein n=1 Tax=Sesamum angolense TaxID=2727404 RepID=A0AAE2BR81_9LAMI|nr:hypothetical protein Sango_1607800 [Sesamum angolense]
MRLANEDGNTKFFHARASPRKQYNTISSLNGFNGVWRDKEEDIQTILLQHFRSIFASSRPSVEHIDEVVSSVLTHINPEMDSQLALPFTTIEVKQPTFALVALGQPYSLCGQTLWCLPWCFVWKSCNREIGFTGLFACVVLRIYFLEVRNSADRYSTVVSEQGLVPGSGYISLTVPLKTVGYLVLRGQSRSPGFL